jgi:hypothetical protein
MQVALFYLIALALEHAGWPVGIDLSLCAFTAALWESI